MVASLSPLPGREGRGLGICESVDRLLVGGL